MQRTQFTFYESFYQALSIIEDRNQRCLAYDAVAQYALTGIEPDLSDAAEVVRVAFALIRPNLNSALRKSAGGAAGKPGSRGKDLEDCTDDASKDVSTSFDGNVKDTNSSSDDAENKKEEEEEVKEEVKEEDDKSRACARVVGVYLDKINATPGQTTLEELRYYAERLDTDVCLKILDVALGEDKTQWSYIRGIFRNAERNGIKTMDDWRKAEQAREARKRAKARDGTSTPRDGDFQPGAAEIEAVKRMQNLHKAKKEAAS